MTYIFRILNRSIQVFFSIILINTYGNAQIVGNEVFLKGNFMEVGISSCGSFGTSSSSTVPSGYHPRTNNQYGLGFVADPARDGWNVGNPNFHGDYFVPGSPVEGWGVQIGSNVYFNGNDNNICSRNQVLGSNVSYTNTNGTLSSTWRSSENFDGGFEIRQTTTFNVNDLSFIVHVDILNNSGASIPELFYLRHVDPDNDVTLSNNYKTINQVVSQASGSDRSVVTATGTVLSNIFIGLGARNPNSRVKFGGFNLPSNISEVWSSVPAGPTTPHTEDEALSLAFRFTDIAAGQCLSFAYAYVLDLNDLDRAVAVTDGFQLFANGEEITDNPEYNINAGESVELSIIGNPDYIWQWTPATGLDGTTGASKIASPTQSIVYTASGTNGCRTAQYQFAINVCNKNDATITNLPTSLCHNAAVITLTGTPTGGSFSGPGVSGNQFNPSLAGIGEKTIIYEVTQNGCTRSTSKTVSVIDCCPQDPSISGLPSAICLKSSAVILTGTPVGGTFTGPGVSGNQFNPLNAGEGKRTITYTVTTNGCTKRTTKRILVTSFVPTPEVTNNSPYCLNAPINLTATSVEGATYHWTGPNNFTATGSSITIPNAELSSVGLYSVYAEANGCTSMPSTTSVTVDKLVTATETHTNLSIAGVNDGTIAVKIIGGAPPYLFKLNQGNYTVDNNFVKLAEGTYSVTIQFGNGCTYEIRDIAVKKSSDDCVR